MGYVQAGYSIVLAILFLYGVSLLFRRRRLERAVARVADATGGHATLDHATADDTGGG
jgi:uncharacterized protein (TIGR03382 family)